MPWRLPEISPGVPCAYPAPVRVFFFFGVESPIPMTLAASAPRSRPRLVGFYDTFAAWNRRRFVV
jgi:hypothetical protein